MKSQPVLSGLSGFLLSDTLVNTSVVPFRVPTLHTDCMAGLSITWVSVQILPPQGGFPNESKASPLSISFDPFILLVSWHSLPQHFLVHVFLLNLSPQACKFYKGGQLVLVTLTCSIHTGTYTYLLNKQMNHNV